MITLLLGFSKRRAEIMTAHNFNSSASLTRKVLEDYTPDMLDQYISISAACTIISYGLYTLSPSTVELHGNANLLYTVPFVIYGIFRYQYMIHKKSKGSDTASDLMTDAHLLLTTCIWAATTIWALS